MPFFSQTVPDNQPNRKRPDFDSRLGHGADEPRPGSGRNHLDVAGAPTGGRRIPGVAQNQGEAKQRSQTFGKTDLL